MLILLKSVSWAATAALTGVALGRVWLSPSRRSGPWLVATAAALLVLLGAAELWLTLKQVRPNADAALLWRYVTASGHGVAVRWRAVAAVAFAAATLLAPRRAWPLTAALGVWLCYGFSRLSHAAAMGGAGPLVVDLVHLAGAVCWAGAVWWLTLRRRPAEAGEVDRLSTLATGVVVALGLTGVVSALFHTGEPDRFFASDYAVALGVKLALVALTLGLAAANRFWLLPRARAGRPGITASLWAESALLGGVLLATGWLTTSAVPHGTLADLDVIENARRVIDHLSR